MASAGRRLLIFTVALASMFAAAGSAGAATSSTLGCRASLARVDVGSLAVEPLVANKASTPCAADSGGVNSIDVPSSAADDVQAGPAGVYTYSSSDEPTTLGPVLPAATALTSIDAASIPQAGITIVGPVQDQVSYVCSADGTVTPSASSTLSAIEIGGQMINLVAPGASETINLGGGAYVSLDEQIKTATTLTERILDVHLANGLDIILGEASVSEGATPCAGSSSGGGGGGGGGGAGGGPIVACPPGSTLDAATQQCVIYGPGGVIIVVSRPFEGPIGGTVISLSEARKLYRSPCLSGKGPDYVIVGTQHADRIIGTHRSERFLGLGGNDRIAGQGGNDCIDGGAGNDRIFGGNGNERVYGGTGNDRLSVQNGNNLVYGGAGNDKIFLGNGNSHVYGQAGNDRISVGRGNSEIWGGAGNDTIATGDGNSSLWGGLGHNKFYAGNGRDHVHTGPSASRVYGRAIDLDVYCGRVADVLYIPRIDFAFARAHRCTRMRAVKLHR